MNAALSHLPLALGGDSLAGSNIGIAAVSLLSIAAGYGLLAALWYFVFRESPQDRDAQRRAADAALQRSSEAKTGPATPTDVAVPATRAPGHGDTAKLERRPGPRFRRR